MKRREVFPFKIIVALSMQQLIFCFKVHYLLQLLNLKVLSVTDSSGTKKVSAKMKTSSENMPKFEAFYWKL